MFLKFHNGLDEKVMEMMLIQLLVVASHYMRLRLPHNGLMGHFCQKNL